MIQRRMTPMYESTAIVYVSPVFPNALGRDNDHDRQYESFLEQQITAATRYETLQKAIEKFPEAWPPVYVGETEQNKVERLQRSLQVRQIGQSYEVGIGLESSNTKYLADFVNDIVAEYLADARSEEVYGREQKLATLNQEKAELQRQLDEDMKKQSLILQNVGMAHFDVSAGANPIDDHLTKLREQYAEAHEKNAEADAELRSLQGENSAALSQAAAEEVSTDLSVTATKSSLNSKKATNLALMTGLKPNNPLYVQMQADNAEIDQKIEQINRDAIKKASARILQRAAGAKARASSLEAQISSDLTKTTVQASGAAPRLQQAQLISSEVDRLLASLGVIESRIQNVSLEGDSPGSVHLFSSALPPTNPLHRKTQLAYGALFVVCLFAGFATAILADALDPYVYTSRDIRRLVGFPPIGLLLSRTEFSPEMQREYYLRLAGGLDQAHRRTGARTFVFPSVGRSSSRDLVEQLGAELSGNGLRVLVVTIQTPSASLPSPTSATTTVSSSRSLSVADSSTMHLSTELDKEPYRVITLPASEVAELLRRSRSYYNAILVAADPLFTSAYTEHFARTADGTVLIVDSGETRKDELVRAARLLERLKIAGIAIVLNGVSEKRAEDDVARTIADYKKNAA
jgi:uncharacterized protein involved in exopolysaccharide biosynthesis